MLEGIWRHHRSVGLSVLTPHSHLPAFGDFGKYPECPGGKGPPGVTDATLALHRPRGSHAVPEGVVQRLLELRNCQPRNGRGEHGGAEGASTSPFWGKPSCTSGGNGFSRELAQEWRINDITALTWQLLFGTRPFPRGCREGVPPFLQNVPPCQKVMGCESPDLSRRV